MCVQYDRVVVDMGLAAKDAPKDWDVLLYTHKHSDHLKANYAKRVLNETNKIIMGPESVAGVVKHKKFITVKAGYTYTVKVKGGFLEITPEELVHDVECYGYKIHYTEIDDDFNPVLTKIFHATDTKSIDHVVARGYDIYGLECNWNQEGLKDFMDNDDEWYLKSWSSTNRHLSEEAGDEWYHRMKKESSVRLYLHLSGRMYVCT